MTHPPIFGRNVCRRDILSGNQRLGAVYNISDDERKPRWALIEVCAPLEVNHMREIADYLELLNNGTIIDQIVEPNSGKDTINGLETAKH